MEHLLARLTSKQWRHDLNPHSYRIFSQNTNPSTLFPIYNSLMLSYCIWKGKYTLPMTLAGPSKSLSNLLFHSHLSLIPHPLTFVLCFTLTELLTSQIYHFTHLSLCFCPYNAFHLLPGKLLFIPQGPAQILYAACKAFQNSLGRVRSLVLCAPWYIFLL